MSGGPVVYRDGLAVPASEADAAQRQADDAAWAARAPAAATVTGNQWIFALKTMRLSDAWELAAAKSKTSDRQRWGAISRDTVIVEGDPLLTRIAANAGTDAMGKPVIDPVAVFAQARTKPT